ncbi:chemotaxis protein CheW [Pseudomonas sp. CGJS7]|uniref:chemotaxis protein CheW n=1 Tax=Pseudomonas sp. CGJS7 TaxID=3109348 RepID=UPI00300B5BA8
MAEASSARENDAVLFLVFHLDRDRYAIEAARVISVLPLVETKAIPRAPEAVAGLFDYRGELLPLIDLCRIALGRAARPVLSTRIIVAEYRDSAGRPRKLGLIGEQVLQTVRLAEADFQESGVDHPDTAYLGPVAADARGALQRVRIEHLLPESLYELLFQPRTADA